MLYSPYKRNYTRRKTRRRRILPALQLQNDKKVLYLFIFLISCSSILIYQLKYLIFDILLFHQYDNKEEKNVNHENTVDSPLSHNTPHQLFPHVTSPYTNNNHHTNNGNIMLQDLSIQRRERYEQVRESIKHAWDGYYKSTISPSSLSSSYFSFSFSKTSLKSLFHNFAHFLIQSKSIPPDDYAPLHNKAIDWLHYAATLHDSLDTLYLAGLHEEYSIALSLVLQQDLQTTSLKPTKTFEYSIRIIGGLLGAFSLTGDVRLLRRAAYAADSLLASPFRSSPTALPRMYDVLFPPPPSSSSPIFLNNSKFYPNNYPSRLINLSTNYITALFYKLYARTYQWGRDKFTNEHHINSLAGVGSFSLEFNFLSLLTNDDRYKKVTDDIHNHVSSSYLQQKDTNDEAKQHHGIINNVWNVMTGNPRGFLSGFGSGCDSYYEYLLKVPIWADCEHLIMGGNSENDLYHNDYSHDNTCDEVKTRMLQQYRDIIQHSLRSKYIYKVDFPNSTTKGRNIAFPVDEGNEFQHLLCFVPGMVALGASTTTGMKLSTSISNQSDDLELAKSLLRGCYEMYKSTPTGLGPEEIRLDKNPESPNNPINFLSPQLSHHRLRLNGDFRYQLRPEFVESIFVLYRLTGDESYQEMGWEVFESIQKYCKTNNGYTGLKNVYSSTSTNVLEKNDSPQQEQYKEGSEQEKESMQENRIDEMPSFFIAETLKYLLLLFGPDDYVSLDEYVFTTEAHPMRKFKAEQVQRYWDQYHDNHVEEDELYQVIPIPVPWSLIITIIVTISLLSWLVTAACKCLLVLKVSRQNGAHRDLTVETNKTK